MDTCFTTHIVITNWRANYTPVVISTCLRAVSVTGRAVSTLQPRSNHVLQPFVSRIGIRLLWAFTQEGGKAILYHDRSYGSETECKEYY
jgi:hypothetical protein